MPQVAKNLKIIIMILISSACGQFNDRNSDEVPHEHPTKTTLDPAATNTGTAIVGQPIANLGILREKVGTSTLNEKNYYGQGVTIAVLDNGFHSLEQAKGKTLPPDLTIEPIYQGKMTKSIHGTKMAEVAYAIATGKKNYDSSIPSPDIKLFVTSGAYYNLNSSIARLIKMKEENPNRNIIALYSQIWEYGGNLDGTGYIDYLVNLAANAGIIWINAAGNVGPSTYVDDIRINNKRQVELPGPDNSLEFEVTNPMTQLKLVLAWNDFSNNYENYFTRWDFDYQLINSSGKVLAEANLIQDGTNQKGRKGYSRHAREQIKAMLNPGTYSVKITTKHTQSQLYQGAKFWVVASGAGIYMKQPSPEAAVLMPADLPNVIAIGGSDIGFGSLSDTKPDLYCPSQILLPGEKSPLLQGTSIAAAVCAGAIATYASSKSQPITRHSVTAISKKSQAGIRKLYITPN